MSAVSLKTVQVPKQIKVCDACSEDIADDAKQDRDYFLISARIKYSRETMDKWVVQGPVNQSNAQLADGTAAFYHVHADCTDQLSGNLLRDLFVNVEVDD